MKVTLLTILNALNENFTLFNVSLYLPSKFHFKFDLILNKRYSFFLHRELNS